jgi:hypothetical protein
MGRRILSAATKAKISASLKGNKNAYSGGPKKVRKPLTARQKVANINAASKKKKMTLSPDAIERRRKVAQRLRTVARAEEAGIKPAHSKPIPKVKGPDPSDLDGPEIRVRVKGKLKGATIVGNKGPIHVGSGDQFNNGVKQPKGPQPSKAAKKVAKNNSGNTVVVGNRDGSTTVIHTDANSTVIINGKNQVSVKKPKSGPDMTARNNVVAANFYAMHGTAGLEKKIGSMDRNITKLSASDYNLLGALKEIRDGNNAHIRAASRAKPPTDPLAKHGSPKPLPKPKKTQAQKDLDAKERRLYGGRKPPKGRNPQGTDVANFKNTVTRLRDSGAFKGNDIARVLGSGPPKVGGTYNHVNKGKVLRSVRVTAIKGNTATVQGNQNTSLVYETNKWNLQHPTLT